MAPAYHTHKPCMPHSWPLHVTRIAPAHRWLWVHQLAQHQREQHVGWAAGLWLRAVHLANGLQRSRTGAGQEASVQCSETSDLGCMGQDRDGRHKGVQAVASRSLPMQPAPHPPNLAAAACPPVSSHAEAALTDLPISTPAPPPHCSSPLKVAPSNAPVPVLAPVPTNTTAPSKSWPLPLPAF